MCFCVPEVALSGFSYGFVPLLHHWRSIVPSKIINGQKKSVGVNFFNVLHTAFTRADPKSVRTQSSLQCLFKLLGSASVKAVCRTLMKLSPGHNMLFNNQLCLSIEKVEVSFTLSLQLELELFSAYLVCPHHQR